ncbi:MAG: hypothetical protein M9963_03695 [Kiritimatiellae bacterium]|nr:hypothetical protein [Kiritimatiellia bacterium]
MPSKNTGIAIRRSDLDGEAMEGFQVSGGAMIARAGLVMREHCGVAAWVVDGEARGIGLRRECVGWAEMVTAV